MAQEQPRGTTQVRGQGWQLGGATPCLRSGAAAKRSHPGARGQGRHPGGATPHLMPGAAARRSNPTPEARGGQEEQPNNQGVVAAWAQEGLQELSHIEGQEGQ